MNIQVKYLDDREGDPIWKYGTLIEILVISSYTYGIVLNQDGKFEQVFLDRIRNIAEGDPRLDRGDP